MKWLKNKIALLFFLMFSFTVSFSQDILTKKFSIESKEVSLFDALQLITKKSGAKFSYNPNKIKIDQIIHFQVVDKSLEEILEVLGDQVGFDFEVVEGQIILQATKRKEKAANKTATLSGYVRDLNTGEAMIGAQLYVSDIKVGVAANDYGFYSLTLPRGNYSVEISFLGYKKLVKEIDLNASQQQDIKMTEDPPLLASIIVNEKKPTLLEETLASKTDIKPKAVEERVAMFGEADVIKSLESIPGIKMHSEGSNFYYVRGGFRDQNLLMLDDAPIYNPSHLLGFFSTVIPDAVNDITVYKGNMPASLGGRLSSVIAVQTKKGNDQNTQLWGSTGLISTKLGLEGPIQKDKSSFLLSTRFSQIKWIFKLNDPSIKQFEFYDITGKVNFKLDARNRVFLSFYIGSDDYFGANSGIRWANKATTLRWNHIVNKKLFLNTTLSASNYDYFLYPDVANDTRWNSHISNANLKADFTYFVKPQNVVTFGLGLSGYLFNPGNLKSNNPNVIPPRLSIRNSGEVVLYGNHEWQLTSRWGLNYGLRFTSWTNTGEAFEYVFDRNRNPIDTLFYKAGEAYKSFVNIEPRLTLSYYINEKSSLKVGYSRNVQNVHLISNSISPFTSLEVWLPSSVNIKPQLADQVVLGYYRSLNAHLLSFVAEGFYKKMYNQIEYTDHAETLLNPLVERELRFGSGTAYGAELQLKKDEGRLRGLVGYTYSRALRQFSEINSGSTYKAFYDRPHQLNLMLAYDISARWNLGVNWNYYTGAPFSSPTGFYSYQGKEVPIYGEKNNDRLPDYHRMDIAATLKLNKNPENKFRHSFTFSIYNFYARKNTLFINYNKQLQPDGSLKVPSNLQDSNQVISQSYLFQFTPSVSYNFKLL